MMALDESLLCRNKRYVVGVSGGPDSMALLDLLRVDGFRCVVCHVNYHVRDDSDLDTDLVKNYCLKYQIPLEIKEIFNYQAGNFEAQARALRYDFYLATAKQYQAEAVLLAHHRDDFLETVLMQQGRDMKDVMFGIATVSHYHDLTVIRPLMGNDKAQLVAYCDQHHVPYRIDYTNLESDYTRNYYRNEILKYYSPEQKDELYQAALKHNQEYQKKVAAYKIWLSQHQTLKITELLSYPDLVGLWRYYLYHYKGFDKTRVSQALVEECIKVMTSPLPNVQMPLPGQFVLIKEYDTVYVTKLSKKQGYHVLIEQIEEKDYGFFKIALSGDDRCGIALKETDLPLTIRSRKDGDVISLSYGQKKVARLMIDAKIPASQRETWPIVLNSRQQIILVPKIAKNKDYLLAKPTFFVIQ